MGTSEDSYDVSEEDINNIQEEQPEQDANIIGNTENNEYKKTEEAPKRISDDVAEDIDNAEIENEEPDKLSDESEDRIIIEDINIMTEMNTSQLAIQHNR